MQQAREARRKRILERGTDRLAYITGELKHSPKPEQLFPTITSSSSNHIISRTDKAEAGNRTLVEDGEDLRHQTEAEIAEIQPALGLSALDQSVQNDTVASLNLESTSANGDASLVEEDQIVGRKFQEPLSRALVQSIDTSESIRAIFALFIAIVVVMQSLLTCCDHSWKSSLSSWVPTWPMIMIFLTDISVVFGVHLTKPPPKQLNADLQGLDPDLGSWSSALNAVGKFEELVDIAILFKKVAGAMSLDCSIYAVTVVCGLCLGQYGFPCCRMPSYVC